MKKAEMENGNLTIANFMGYGVDEFGAITEKDSKVPIIQKTDLRYNIDWNFLMPVVEKIAKDYDVKITWMPTALNVTYIDRPDVSEGEITSMGGMTAIENTFIAVIRFIEWYNTNGAGRKKV